MKLSDIFKRLVSGEFQRHSLGEDLVNGSLNSDHYSLVLPMFNMGIDAIHTRFVVREDQIIVRLQEWITRYTLHTDHAMYNNTDTTGEKPKYLHDTNLYPFTNTVIKILSIYNEMGQERFVNDSNQQYAIHLNNYNTFQHPYPDKENAVSVTYQATLPDVELTDNFKPEEVEIDLPIMFVEPLCYYIGSRVHVGMTDQQTLIESNNFMSMYEKAMARISKDQMLTSDLWTSDQFEERGWV